MFRKLLLITFLTGFSFFLYAQEKASPITISGYVHEKGSGELLPGVTVYEPTLQLGVSTNTYGFYSLTIPSGTRKIVCSFIGYKSFVIEKNFTEDMSLDIHLEEDIQQLEEVEIVASQQTNVSETVQMSTVGLPIQQVQDIPAFLGEKDVIKVMQLMPGVQSGSEGSSGLFVRGGSNDQNLIILDDAVVYNADHLFGFFSVFNGDALKNVELYKGGFPARFGGRLSSVMNIDMKEGNKEGYHGKISSGLISTSATLEGPIAKNKSSFLISGRRTYLDLLARPLMPDDESAGYYFYDLNAKVNYDFGPKNKLYLSGYFGRDKFYLNIDDDDLTSTNGIAWGNQTGTLRWNHLFHNKLFLNTTFVVSNYKFGIESESVDRLYDESYFMNYYSTISDYTLKGDLDFIPSPKHHIKLGASMSLHRFAPSALVLEGYEEEFDIDKQEFTHTYEGGLYIEDIFKPTHQLTVNGGIRLSTFTHNSVNYFNPEPRLSISYRLDENKAIKASYAMMNQYIHRLSNTGIGLPTDLWVSSTENVAPQRSQQIALGYAQDLPHNLSFTAEAYYKLSDGVIQYKEGASFLALDFEESENSGQIEFINWEENITRGSATSYGLELLLQRKVGKLSGWIGYTLSWAKYQFAELNGGNTFYAPHDRRHDLSIVSIYKPTPKISLSATWVYGSGTPVSIATSRYNTEEHQPTATNKGWYYNSKEVDHYGERSNFRMTPYHRLDLSVRFHKQKEKSKRTWEISVYNAYNRNNAFFYYPETSYIENGFAGREVNQLKQASIFPIIPSVSYRLDF